MNMNNSNNNNSSHDAMPFATGSWGSFSSRYDRQPNYKNSGNTARPNFNDEINTCDSTQPNGAGGSSFDDNQSNLNNYKLSSDSYFNQNSINEDDYQQNSNRFGSQQNSKKFGYQRNSKNFGSQQNGSNSNFFGSQQNRSNSNNFGSWKTQSNFNNFKARGGHQSGPGSFGNGGYGGNQNQYSNKMNDNGGSNTSSNYVPFRKFREHFSNRPNDNAANNDNSPAPSLFMGRDQSYPDELNNLMNPFFCGVCNCRMNSIKSGNIHYESKAHDKQITNWMKKNYAEKGLAVPEVQRFVTEEAIGPYRCELCKLDLTSAQHALQHYNGKRHRQAATKVSPPTGIGYYNVDGNWVETGKVLDKITGKETSYILVNTPTGFEPVVLYVAPNTVAGVKRPANIAKEPLAKKPTLAEPHDAEKEKTKKMKEEQYRTMVTQYEKNKQNTITTNEFKTVSLDGQESSNTGQTPQQALNSMKCDVCGIATTSYDQMLLHLKGLRHTKKLRALGEPPISDLFQKSPTTILESLNSNNPEDVSMYRTPTGSYYCKTCDVGLEDIARIKKHISSKAHLAAVKKTATVEQPNES